DASVDPRVDESELPHETEAPAAPNTTRMRETMRAECMMTSSADEPCQRTRIPLHWPGVRPTLGRRRTALARRRHRRCVAVHPAGWLVAATAHGHARAFSSGAPARRGRHR